MARPCSSFFLPPLPCRFQKWPADALAAVALKFLTEMELDANTRSKLVGLCQAMHTRITQASEGEAGDEVWRVGCGLTPPHMVPGAHRPPPLTEFLSDLGRHNYVTPTSYLELIAAFRTLLEAKRAQNTKMKSRYLVGLEKLQSSAQQVGGAGGGEGMNC